MVSAAASITQGTVAMPQQWYQHTTEWHPVALDRSWKELQLKTCMTIHNEFSYHRYPMSEPPHPSWWLPIWYSPVHFSGVLHIISYSLKFELKYPWDQVACLQYPQGTCQNHWIEAVYINTVALYSGQECRSYQNIIRQHWSYSSICMPGFSMTLSILPLLTAHITPYTVCAVNVVTRGCSKIYFLQLFTAHLIISEKNNYTCSISNTIVINELIFHLLSTWYGVSKNASITIQLIEWTCVSKK